MTDKRSSEENCDGSPQIQQTQSAQVSSPCPLNCAHLSSKPRSFRPDRSESSSTQDSPSSGTSNELNPRMYSRLAISYIQRAQASSTVAINSILSTLVTSRLLDARNARFTRSTSPPFTTLSHMPVIWGIEARRNAGCKVNYGSNL